MPSWKVWVQRPSGLIKMKGSSSTFNECYLGKGREVGIEGNFDNWSQIIIIQHKTQNFKHNHTNLTSLPVDLKFTLLNHIAKAM